eukprot:c5936_g1_i1.p1 GENE.c5936_g1_i1~~c5936_g1_i1.p1  ORF type:complete len:359 (-),score=68.36 c5936_g1_i1:424-1401(-)
MKVLEKALTLDRLNENEFRSISLWRPTNARGVFGGQVIGQAMVAACATVTAEYCIHSMHSYFINRGDPAIPILYKVSEIRNGTSFCTRFVNACQNDKVIFTVILSFQRPDKSPHKLELQSTMPIVPSPDSLAPREKLFEKWLETPNLPEVSRAYLEHELTQPFPIDMRHCDQSSEIPNVYAITMVPRHCIWIKTRGPLGDDVRAHRCVAAYFSDYHLLVTALLPVGHPNHNLTMIASLDHSMWFHAPFRADEWLLYEMEATRASDGRALCFGRMYRADGTLVMSVAQEGLLRFRAPPHIPPSRELLDKIHQQRQKELQQHQKSKL